MLYAVDKINRNQSLLPGVNLGRFALLPLSFTVYALGVHILDTCTNEGIALEQTLEFIKTAINQADSDDEKYQCSDGSKPVGVVQVYLPFCLALFLF